MKNLLELSNEEAKNHLLKGSSYFNADMPDYVSFEPLIKEVGAVLNGNNYKSSKSREPHSLQKVNYNILSNKDGKFAWRPLELINPIIYISLVNTICDNKNWGDLQTRFQKFESVRIKCCSIPVVSQDNQSDKAKGVETWWNAIEQESLIRSLEFSHILHTDVTDCYGSLYTHSVSWALHGIEQSKKNTKNDSLLGNNIDLHIRAGRYGQTNGISQGSVLMDLIAELVLGYVDEQVNIALEGQNDFYILRYRDDYRIFANSDERAESILQVISNELHSVGMKLNTSKTSIDRNVIKGSVKPDKIAALELKGLGNANARTVQKQLLRLHSFGQRFPNSGALKRLTSEFHKKIFVKLKDLPKDYEVLVAIATDIGFVSPDTFRAVAAIVSKLISLAPPQEKERLLKQVEKKMKRVPNNGYLEIWLQRIIQANTKRKSSDNEEIICKIVTDYDNDIKETEMDKLWNNSWVSNKNLIYCIKNNSIAIKKVSEADEVISPEEIKLFTENAWMY